MIRDWLRIARSQTAAAVIMLCGIFFLLGGGNLFSILGLFIVIFSIFVHDLSFAHNSIIDVLIDYDTRDKFKIHFPLCNGRVRPLEALKATHLGMFFITVFAILLCYYAPGNGFYAMSCYAVFILAGFWYNEWTSKISIWDFVPISISFTSLAMYAYFLMNQSFSPILIFAVAYVFFLEWYEISVAGEIKEAETTGEIGMLRRLGAKIQSEYFEMGEQALMYSWFVKCAGIFLLGIIALVYNRSGTSIFAFVVMSCSMIYFAWKLTIRQKWNRDKSLRYMACEEIVSIFALPFMLIPMIDTVQTIILVSFSLFYFVMMNSLNWGTFLKPQV